MENVQISQSHLGLQTNCPATYLGIRRRHRQRRGPPDSGNTLPSGSRIGGPSWLSFIGHAKDSFWSLDLFRCESAILRTYWVLVVMDQFTRRIVGFVVHRGVVDGVALCRMFNRAIHTQALPKYLSIGKHHCPAGHPRG